MRNNHLRIMIITALLLGIGLVFHTVVPGIFFGMKPDFILAFMFIAFLINPKYENAFLIGLAGGILSGLTTSVAGGFIPNLVDKIITMNLVYVLYTILNTALKNVIKGKLDQNFIIAPILGLIGTIISGIIFISTAVLFGALSINAFLELFQYVVILAALVNVVIILIVYYAFSLAMKRSNFEINNV